MRRVRTGLNLHLDRTRTVGVLNLAIPPVPIEILDGEYGVQPNLLSGEVIDVVASYATPQQIVDRLVQV